MSGIDSRVRGNDTVLDLPAGATREELLEAMDGHILGAGVLIGERQGKLIMRATG